MPQMPVSISEVEQCQEVGLKLKNSVVLQKSGATSGLGLPAAQAT